MPSYFVLICTCFHFYFWFLDDIPHVPFTQESKRELLFFFHCNLFLHDSAHFFTWRYDRRFPSLHVHHVWFFHTRRLFTGCMYVLYVRYQDRRINKYPKDYKIRKWVRSLAFSSCLPEEGLAYFFFSHRATSSRGGKIARNPVIHCRGIVVTQLQRDYLGNRKLPRPLVCQQPEKMNWHQTLHLTGLDMSRA